MLEAVFFQVWGPSQKYSSIFSGTIILEAVLLHIRDAPKNIVPFFRNYNS